MLPRLVHRLCTPFVASVASKEQLCLSLASIAQLFPRSLDAARRGSAQPSYEAAALVSRAIRLAPSCSGRELGMMARGSTSLGYTRTDFVDILAKEVLWHCEHDDDRQDASTAKQTVRLQDVVDLFHAAIASDSAFNATLKELAVRHAPALLQSTVAPKDRAAMLQTFLQAVEIYFMGGVEVREVVLSLRTATAADDKLDGVHGLLTRDDRTGDAATSLTASSIAHRRQRFSDSERLDEPVDPTAMEWHARKRLYDIAQQVHLSTSASIGDVPTELLLEAMGELAHYRFVDPVAQRALEALAWERVTNSPTDSQRIVEVAFAHSSTFRQFCENIRRRLQAGGGAPGAADIAGQSSALQQTSAVRVAFDNMLKGQKVSEETLLLVSEQFDVVNPDNVAFTAALFATLKETPMRMVSAVQAAALQLSLAGVAALVWAARKDQSGCLLAPTEAAIAQLLSRGSGSGGFAQHASVEDIAALVQALLQLPQPRHVSLSESFLQKEAQLSTAVADLLVEFVLAREGEGPALEDLLRLGVLTSEAKAVEEFLALLCDRVAKTSSRALSQSEATMAMSLLLSRRDFVHEALADRLALHLKTLVRRCIAGNEGDGEQVLAMIRLQVRLDLPELDACAAELLRHVQLAVSQRTADGAGGTAPVSAEVLIAASLLACRWRRLDLVQLLVSELASLLTARAQEGRWLGQAALEGGQDLVAALASSASPAQAASVLNAVISHMGGWSPATPISGATFASGDTAAEFMAACLRLCAPDTSFFTASQDASPPPLSPLSPTVIAFVENRLLTGISPTSFTTLCRSLYRGASTADYLPRLSNAVVDTLPRLLDQLSTTQISQCVWGLGQLPDAGQRLNHQLMSEAVSDYVVDNSELFWSGPDIAAMLYGFSRLHCTKRSLYSVFCTRLSLRPIRATMSREAVGLVLSALGTVKYLDKELFDRFGTSYARHAPALTSADLLQSVKAHSRVMLLNDGFFDAMAEEIVRRPSSVFPLLAKCDLLHAYGAVGRPADAMAAQLAAAIAEEVEQLPSANAATDVLSSLWLMDYAVDVDPKLQPLVAHVEAHAEELSSTSLLKLCSMLTDRTWRLPGLLKALGDQCVRLRRAEDLTPEAARVALDTFARYNFHHRQARQEVAQLARTVSKEAPQLSEDEEEQLNLLLSR